MNTLAELSIIRASDEHCFNCVKYWETNNGRGTQRAVAVINTKKRAR